MKTKSKIKKNKNKKSRYKLKTVLFKCGYFRRSEKFIKEFNELLNENGMIVEPKLTTNIPNSINDWIYFKFDEPLENIKPSKKGGNIKMAYNFKPYDHQKEAWNHMDKHYIDDNKNRGMVVLPTGAGKTTVAAYWLIRKYINEGYRVLWLSHRVELLEQAFDTFRSFSYLIQDKELYLNMIIISGNYNSWSSVDKRYNVVFSTDRSTALNLNHLELMMSQSDKGIFAVIDEAHHTVASQYRNILETMFSNKGNKDMKLLGLTATPVRMNPNETQLLWRIYDDNFDIIKPSKKTQASEYNSIIYEVSQNQLIQENILSKPYPSTVDTKIDFEIEFTEKDYKHLEQFGDLGQDVLNKITNSSLRNEIIVKHYKDNMKKYGKTLVFAIDIPHCITLNEEFQGQGIKSDYVAYSKGNNAEVIEKFKNTDELQVIISVIKLTEGFDAPNIQTVFLTRPTRSEPLLRQMIGRGLRGPKAGGTEDAYLVTFVDTWKLFKPLDPGYILDVEKVIEDPKPEPKPSGDLTLIPMDEFEKIVKAAYELLLTKPMSYDFTIFETFPHSWYQWTREEEGEEREDLVFVFENQYEFYQDFIEHYQNNKKEIPKILNEETTREIIYKFFDDCSDPLPDYNDIIKLAGAVRRDEKINHFTFKEKEKVDPATLAREYISLNSLELRDKLREIYDNNKLCRIVYKDIFENFLTDVMKETTEILTRSMGPDKSPDKSDEDKIIELPVLPQYSEGEGYDLEEIMESVIYTDKNALNKSHFPNGEPPKYRISFTSNSTKTYFGICRYSDETIKINKALNSPKIPRFVMEFLVYHEVLHADMPNNGHDKVYRERERKFIPSKIAEEEAKEFDKQYKYDENVSYYWYTVSNQFLDTIHWDYKIEDVK